MSTIAELSTLVLTHRPAVLLGEVALAGREGWSDGRIRELLADRVEALGELQRRAEAEAAARGRR